MYLVDVNVGSKHTCSPTRPSITTIIPIIIDTSISISISISSISRITSSSIGSSILTIYSKNTTSNTTTSNSTNTTNTNTDTNTCIYNNRNDSSNTRSGGGAGVLRPNINVDQIQKSIRYLKESIKKCGLLGASTLFDYEECENEFQEKLGMMHLKAKTTLTNKQNRKGKYAVPIMDSEEGAINSRDTDTELFIWNNSSGATINYNKLKELVNPKKHKWLRPESDINNILKNYHKKWY